jgi:hypothetical protein
MGSRDAGKEKRRREGVAETTKNVRKSLLRRHDAIYHLSPLIVPRARSNLIRKNNYVLDAANKGGKGRRGVVVGRMGGGARGGGGGAHI